MSNSACYTIDDVMRLTSVSRRTVRYYVTRELIPPPDGRGVGLHYRQEHVDGILRVLEAKERGASLASIAGAERERSQRTFAEQDGGTPNPSVAVDHGGPKGEAAMSKDQSSGNAKAATPDARLARILTNGNQPVPRAPPCLRTTRSKRATDPLLIVDANAPSATGDRLGF